MNILFVLYNDFHANSAIQVHHFANALVERGHDCAIAVPQNKESCYTHIGGAINYTPLNFNETLKKPIISTNGKTFVPGIIYAWTPREIVRTHCEKLRKLYPDSKLLVDLEDNEEIILESNLGLPFSQLQKHTLAELDQIVPNTLSHPVRYREFLQAADGVTVIMDTLLDFVPPAKPSLVLWPILDEQRFYAREKSEAFLEKWGLSADEIMLAYVGNVHSSNWQEVRSLYLAVALANRQGIPCRLLRAGKDYYPFWGEQKSWSEQYAVDLGLISNRQIPEVLANADLLVQPGKADKFNNFRLPSKIPEFLAMKKPVALPYSNVGRFLEDEQEAIILRRGDALEILEVIRRYAEDPDVFGRIAEGGQRFVHEKFGKEGIGQKLEAFLQTILFNGEST